jgi:hypothetical protein
MLKFILLFVYLIYFTATQIKRFKQLCLILDTIYLFTKIIQYKQNVPPIHPPYTPSSLPPFPHVTHAEPKVGHDDVRKIFLGNFFGKFFWEIFLGNFFDLKVKHLCYPNFFLGKFSS